MLVLCPDWNSCSAPLSLTAQSATCFPSHHRYQHFQSALCRALFKLKINQKHPKPISLPSYLSRERDLFKYLAQREVHSAPMFEQLTEDWEDDFIPGGWSLMIIVSWDLNMVVMTKTKHLYVELLKGLLIEHADLTLCRNKGWLLQNNISQEYGKNSS